jgi:capsule polysaccharide export protein KpsE/RkpR
VDQAMSMLADNTEFLVDDEYEHLTIAVNDTDPERAAAIANYYVEELTKLNSELSALSASKFRQYVEQRHDETLARLDSVNRAFRDFQQKYGVMELQTQGEAFLTFTAELRLAVAEAELQYETLLSQYGPDNSTVQAARQQAASARRTYQQALGGAESLMPVSKDNLPAVSLEYIDLERERLIQAKLLEYIRPVLEEARFDEERQVEAVQVVDQAVPPTLKYAPKRSIICIAAVLSAFILSVLFVLVYTWWRRNYAYYAHRLREAADRAEAKDRNGPPPASEPTPAFGRKVDG